MATKIVKVIRVGFEKFHEDATEKLKNIDNEIEEEVALYRETIVANKKDDISRLQTIVEKCTEEKEVEEEENEEVENNEEVLQEEVYNQNEYIG